MSLKDRLAEESKAALKAGEKVIIQGQQRVRAGMTVTPTAAPALKG